MSGSALLAAMDCPFQVNIKIQEAEVIICIDATLIRIYGTLIGIMGTLIQVSHASTCSGKLHFTSRGQVLLHAHEHPRHTHVHP